MRPSVLVAAVLLAAVGVSALGKHPLKLPYEKEPCYPIGTTDADICYPTRCRHLFEYSTDGKLSPVPVSGYPQDYPRFRCKVEEYAEYDGPQGVRRCLKPTCVCRVEATGDETSSTCQPAIQHDCLQHRCDGSATP